MKNNKRQIVLTVGVVALFCAWLGLLIYQADRYRGSERMIYFTTRPAKSFSLRVEMFERAPLNRRSHVVERFYNTSYSTKVQPTTLFAPQVKTAHSTVSQRHVVSQDMSHTQMLHDVYHHADNGSSFVSVPLSSLQTVRTYTSGGALAGAAVSPSQGRSNGVAAASYSTMLASNTITTAASLLRGGVTTFDSDAAVSPAIRRSPTPGDPDEENELPIDAGNIPATALLALMAVIYAGIKNKAVSKIS